MEEPKKMTDEALLYNFARVAANRRPGDVPHDTHPDLIPLWTELRIRLRAHESLVTWTHQYGEALKPTGGSRDTYGDGMRAAKDQVSALLRKPILDEIRAMGTIESTEDKKP